MDKLKPDSAIYRYIENEGLKLMIRLDALTDLTLAVRALRRKMVRKVQQIFDTLEANTSCDDLHMIHPIPV